MPSFRRDRPPRARPPRQIRELDLSAVRSSAQAAWRQGEALAAAGDLAGGLAWLDRAHRIAPSDQNLSFALAWLRLRAGDPGAAATLFGAMAERHNVRECWTGLAAACLQAGDCERAQAAAQQALSGHTTDPALASVAAQIVLACNLVGWCGLQSDGTLLAEAPGETLTVVLDGSEISPTQVVNGGFCLPAHWPQARRLSVSAGGTALLGSPIAPSAVTRVEGFVARTAQGVEGWAWAPCAPELDPELRIVQSAGNPIQATILTASQLMSEVDGTIPLARPRSFAWAVGAGCGVRVTSSNGRDLLGSPLPAQDEFAGALTGPPARLIAEPDLPVDVIVPVYRGLQATLDCIASVEDSVAAPDRIVVVDDGSPEPELVAALDALATAGTIMLIRPAELGPHSGGFPAAVNAGIRVASGRHVVLLNSDTLVAPGWLHGLRAAACSAPDIGTATPLSNEASIFSYPAAAGGNPAPDLAATRSLASLAARANAFRLVDVPTAHGFCMFIRHDCLAATGRFEEGLFAQGYGEENDFSERATALGYRHVAVPGIYVAHLGGVSFGAAGRDLLRRNLAILNRLHPGYAKRVADFVEADLLAPARRRLDVERWLVRGGEGGPQPASVLLVTHGGGGGTARIVGERAKALQHQGLRPVVLSAVEGLCAVGDAEGVYPNLVYALPSELGPLARLLSAGAPVSAELHHLLGHDHSVLRLFAALRIPYDVWIHDYSWFCPRLSFVTGEGRFCGEAPATVCDPCVARWGRGIEDPIPAAALRVRSAADLQRAHRVVVPSADVARRVSRHVPGLVPEIVAWEEPPVFCQPSVNGGRGRRKVAVVGAIGMEKGLATLLACAQDASARALKLEFVVIGYTSDDAALLETGRVFITGEFARSEAIELIRSQQPNLAFLPSIWPETWCYALSDVWSAGLSAAVFDIGTPADRVRHYGRGWVLPLGLPPSRVNDVLLGLGS